MTFSQNISQTKPRDENKFSGQLLKSKHYLIMRQNRVLSEDVEMKDETTVITNTFSSECSFR